MHTGSLHRKSTNNRNINTLSMKRTALYLSFFLLSAAFVSCTTTTKQDEADISKLMKSLEDSLKTAAASADDPANSPVYTLGEGELDSLITWVRDDIQESYKKSPSQDFINVESLTLRHSEGNHYTGVMKTEEKGYNHSYDVKVSYDGSFFQWEVK